MGFDIRYTDLFNLTTKHSRAQQISNLHNSLNPELVSKGLHRSGSKDAVHQHPHQRYVPPYPSSGCQLSVVLINIRAALLAPLALASPVPRSDPGSDVKSPELRRAPGSHIGCAVSNGIVGCDVGKAD